MQSKQSLKRRLLYGAVGVLVVAVGVTLYLYKSNDQPYIPVPAHDSESDQAPAPPLAPQPIHEGDILKIANKAHNIGDYVPDDLITGAQGQTYRAIMDNDLRTMFTDAAADGIRLNIVSAYRSYATQKSLYNSYVAKDGLERADRYSARAGHSEHQLGLAIDFEINSKLNETPAGKWLLAHAAEYGFILRYTEENTAVTGYMSEPWHYRYIGRHNAALFTESGAASLEEWLNVPGGDYPS